MSVLLTLRRPFVADHFHDRPGFQEDRHGHNWEAEVTFVLAGQDQEQACAEALDAWIRQVDYSLLNDQPSLDGRNPTTELLAQWLFNFLEERGRPAVRVKLREKANYWAACTREAS